MKMKKIFALALTAVLALTAFAACSGGSSGPETAAPAAMQTSNSTRIFGESKFATDVVEDVAEYEADAMEAPAQAGGGEAGQTVTPVLDSRKIIKNVNMQLQTLTFDSGVDEITKAAESYGGYVQDSYIDGRDMYNARGTRTASFTLRIPSEQLDSFVNALGGQFNVISKSENKQDITDSYYDSKARLDALKIEEEALLAMLQGSPDLEYMLEIRKELMNVRYEIESLTSALNRMDSYVSLSTVNITLYEVVKYEPVEDVPATFGERISRAFSRSWIAFAEFSQDFAVVFVEALPFLLVLAVVVIIVTLVIRRSKKRRAKRAQLNHQYSAQNIQNLHHTQDTQNAQNISAEAPAEKAEESDKE